MLEGVAGSGQDLEHWMGDQSSLEGQRSVGQDSDPEERLNFPDQQAGHLQIQKVIEKHHGKVVRQDSERLLFLF